MLGSGVRNAVFSGRVSSEFFVKSLGVCQQRTYRGLQDWTPRVKISSEQGGRRGIQGIDSVWAKKAVRALQSESSIQGSASTMAIPAKQTAWMYNEYGPKENLFLTEVDVAELGPEEVLVKGKAVSLNPIDSKRREGYLKEKESPPPSIPGFDIAGEIVKVGSQVSTFKVGDRVYADASEFVISGNGTLAQYTKVQEKLLDIIPEPLSFAEAASLPLALQTAYQALEKAGLKERQTVLILGGSGGVGTLALQLAKHVFKASVIATTASGHKTDLMKSLGATVVIDYKNEPLSEHPTKYDVVFDTVGKGEGPLCVKENGSAITIAGPAQAPEIRYMVTSRGSDLKKLSPLFGNGTLKPVVDKLFKFSDLLLAFEYLESGRATGKVVVSPID